MPCGRCGHSDQGAADRRTTFLSASLTGWPTPSPSPHPSNGHLRTLNADFDPNQMTKAIQRMIRKNSTEINGYARRGVIQRNEQPTADLRRYTGQTTYTQKPPPFRQAVIAWAGLIGEYLSGVPAEQWINADLKAFEDAACWYGWPIECSLSERPADRNPWRPCRRTCSALAAEKEINPRNAVGGIVAAFRFAYSFFASRTVATSASSPFCMDSIHFVELVASTNTE